jgi:hypothetical protein
MAHLMQYVHASAESKNFLNKKRKKMQIYLQCKNSQRFVHYYSLRIKIFVAIDLFHNFEHLSRSKNYASIIYFACYMFYYCRYFKLDLSFYTFARIF